MVGWAADVLLSLNGLGGVSVHAWEWNRILSLWQIWHEAMFPIKSGHNQMSTCNPSRMISNWIGLICYIQRVVFILK